MFKKWLKDASPDWASFVTAAHRALTGIFSPRLLSGGPGFQAAPPPTFTQTARMLVVRLRNLATRTRSVDSIPPAPGLAWR